MTRHRLLVAMMTLGLLSAGPRAACALTWFDLDTMAPEGVIDHPEGAFSDHAALPGPVPGIEYYWDMQGTYRGGIVVVSTDHLPAPYEFGFTVFGSNDLEHWSQATYAGQIRYVLEEECEENHEEELEDDDFGILWDFDDAYRYLGVWSDGGMVLSAARHGQNLAEYDGIAVPIPEPSTLMLLGLGVLGGALPRRRRRSS